MATVITKTVKPSGGNYSLVSLAVADIPSDIVATDEQWDIICDTFVGGMSDGFDMPSINSNASCFVRIAAASGHKYKRSDNSGFYMEQSRNSDGVITNFNTEFLRMENFGLKNLGTVTSARGYLGSQHDCQFEGMYATVSGTTQICYNSSAGERCVWRNCLAEGGKTGITFGNFSGATVDNLTVIDSLFGYSKSAANRTVTITNSLYIGSGDFYDVNSFGGGSDYNASSGTAPSGANSLGSRTTADLADYAGNDYRTASGSALATAGASGTYIGFQLESGVPPEPTFSSYWITNYSGVIQ